MAYTDNCDLHAAVHEDGMNRIIRHVLRQRPSLFNYSSAYVSTHEFLWCAKVDRTSDVDKYNPGRLFTLELPPLNALPVVGADAPVVGLNFCAQLVDARIDFYPSNVFPLPHELNPPLPDQQFAFKVKLCGGLDCPSPDFLREIPPANPLGNQSFNEAGVPDGKKLPQVVPPTRKLLCFCLEAYLVGHIERISSYGVEWLTAIIDGVDIVDIKPDALEANLNCYLKTVANVLLREKLTFPMNALLFNIPLAKLATITLSPTPNPPVPNNPAVEDDQLKIFVDVKVGP